jgi:hypothetical protein
MSLRSLVKNGVKKAFKLAGDLCVNVELTQKAPTGFNFDTLAATESTSSVITVKALIITKQKQQKEDVSSDVEKLYLLFNNDDVAKFNIFDTATVNGKTYIPERPYKDNGYVTEITFARSN